MGRENHTARLQISWVPKSTYIVMYRNQPIIVISRGAIVVVVSVISLRHAGATLLFPLRWDLPRRLRPKEMATGQAAIYRKRSFLFKLLRYSCLHVSSGLPLSCVTSQVSSPFHVGEAFTSGTATSPVDREAHQSGGGDPLSPSLQASCHWVSVTLGLFHYCASTAGDDDGLPAGREVGGVVEWIVWLESGSPRPSGPARRGAGVDYPVAPLQLLPPRSSSSSI